MVRVIWVYILASLVSLLVLTSCAPLEFPLPTVPAPDADADADAAVDALSTAVIDLTERFNTGDLEGVLDAFADDAMVYFFGMSPTGSEIYWGKERFCPVWEENIASHLAREVEIDKVVGDTVIGRSKTWHDFTRQLGVAPLEASEAWVIRDGKVAFYAWTLTEDSTTRLKAALAEAMPEEHAPGPVAERPVAEITVTFADGTCLYDGSLTLQLGQI